MNPHSYTSNDLDAMLAKILGAATVMDHNLATEVSDKVPRDIGKRLGLELAAMISAGIAPQLVLVAAFGVASRVHFQMVIGMCDGLELALQSMTPPKGELH